jgi:predicted TPR repeat methyltransferase
MSKRDRFDKAYYDHFYGPTLHNAADKLDEERLMSFVCAYLKYMKQPVRNVVDIGCGFGVWRDAVAQHFPRARYTGVELSEYLCEEYGWKQGSVVDFSAKRPFDLVICKDTLQYLPPKDCEVAIENLARLCRGTLYLSVMTTEDWNEVCDQRRTDSQVYKRSVSWYRRQLRRWFINIGGGLFLSERSPSMPWALEQIGT